MFFKLLKAIRLSLVEALRIPVICPYPFSKITVGSRGFVPCCRSFLKEEHYKLDVGENPWNGPQAVTLRMKLLRNDYSSCNTDLCKVTKLSYPELFFLRFFYKDLRLSIGNLVALLRRRPQMPEGPSNVVLTADERCNLACASCRTSKKTQLTENENQTIKKSEEQLRRYRSYVRILHLAGGGEVLFSPWLRGILKEASPAVYPKLSHINVLTNGLLFNSQNLNDLLPGSAYIQNVSISIDAADAATYEKVRGGNWETLKRNLHWAAEQRRQGRFKWLGINFAFRRANFKTIPQFLKMGESIGVDRVRFAQLERWDGMGIKNYEEEAVHLPQHTDHTDFKNIYKEVKNHPIVRFQFSTESN